MATFYSSSQYFEFYNFNNQDSYWFYYFPGKISVFIQKKKSSYNTQNFVLFKERFSRRIFWFVNSRTRTSSDNGAQGVTRYKKLVITSENRQYCQHYFRNEYIILYKSRGITRSFWTKIARSKNSGSINSKCQQPPLLLGTTFDLHQFFEIVNILLLSLKLICG